MTNVALVPPLLRLPPTAYDVLYTGIMRAHDITTHVMGSESITVITLDLQLYDMAMKLWVERERTSGNSSSFGLVNSMLRAGHWLHWGST